MKKEIQDISLLFVEDEHEARKNISEMISRRVSEFFVAENANQAIEIYKKHKPDLLLSDIRMPGMNGLQMVQIIKEINPLVKIIMMTAFTDTDYLLKCIDLQVDGYIVKPVYKTKLLSAINKQADIILSWKRIKMQEKEKILYTKQLEEQNKDLDDFSHTVAHDLKNPLGSMMNFSNLIVDSFDEFSKDEIRYYLSLIAKEGERTQQIINSLLLFAKIRKTDVELKELNMSVIVNKTIKRLSEMINEKNASIKLHDNWPVALGYPDWIEEVWINYLSNALKYGGVMPQIEIGYDMFDPQKENIRFWIKDFGKGISEKNQNLLFKKFEQLDQVNITGHGLGLSIVSSIINKLGGKVGVESKIGEGSLFYFTLPHYGKPKDEYLSS
ncbi:MAG: response regulator [Bacteroidota bacterium]|nr:response regulator [Bacteroidota bacterium]